ncbi:16S rRNA (guanine(966)-N(2))-methyltransferase RsmD [Desulforamulus ferrireducens]|uniref:16S rRNA (Guanine(966)-N(2))-methyltransferase RsmD n=1 Tax=Desulforamulus ferrireducens TaxID=1833852 RepID=A0A1S6IXG0_9FIRM|nr:16S rRNA (guanine(966)-N(2))-methyltransferase RsmD [Desulforamulus ferrireducens]AQS59467.1 16S rRNA (guanine(966)-N(2))-methyltransferase RsmD [Desulforamulus ferrireducens]
MRIIAGSARGRNLKSPKGMSTRPTSDRVREALFNIINPYLADCRFLDLFSGTGAVGIEALSRGAAKAVLVEKDRSTAKIILDNLDLCRLKENAEVLTLDVAKAISLLGQRGESFDIIFLDPPYKKGFEQPTIAAVLSQDILAPQGIVIVESNKVDLPPERVEALCAYRREKYGDTALTFYRYDIKGER